VSILVGPRSIYMAQRKKCDQSSSKISSHCIASSDLVILRRVILKKSYTNQRAIIIIGVTSGKQLKLPEISLIPKKNQTRAPTLSCVILLPCVESVGSRYSDRNLSPSKSSFCMQSVPRTVPMGPRYSVILARAKKCSVPKSLRKVS